MVKLLMKLLVKLLVKITIKICTRNNKKSVTKLCKLYKAILDYLRDYVKILGEIKGKLLENY